MSTRVLVCNDEICTSICFQKKKKKVCVITLVERFFPLTVRKAE